MRPEFVTLEVSMDPVAQVGEDFRLGRTVLEFLTVVLDIVEGLDRAGRGWKGMAARALTRGPRMPTGQKVAPSSSAKRSGPVPSAWPR